MISMHSSQQIQPNHQMDRISFFVKSAQATFNYLFILHHQEKLYVYPIYMNGSIIKINKTCLNTFQNTIFQVFNQTQDFADLKIVSQDQCFFFKKTLSNYKSSHCQFSKKQDYFHILNSYGITDKIVASMDDILVKVQTYLSAKNTIKHLKSKRRSQNNKNLLRIHGQELSCRKKIQEILSTQIIEQRQINFGQVDANQAESNFQRNQDALNYTKNVPDSNIFKVNFIQIQKKQNLKNITGGVSMVQIFKVNKIQFSDSSLQQQTQINGRQIVRKKIIPSQLSNKEQKSTVYRFQREIQVLQQIGKNGYKDYLCQYFIPNNLKITEYYLNKEDISLKQFLKFYHHKLNILDLLNLSNSIVKIIINLHSNGVVHRDLKPDNIMLSRSNHKFKLKLIDFSDSGIIGQNFNYDNSDHIYLCGTIPFSPIQTDKSNSKYKSHGICNKQIDYWSIGVLLNIIFFRNSSINFTKIFWKQINALWESQFLSYERFVNSHGLQFVNQVIWLISTNLLVKPQKRMKINKVSKILHSLSEFVQKLIKSQKSDFRYFQIFE